MALFLSSKKIEAKTGSVLVATINEYDAEINAISAGERVLVELTGFSEPIPLTINTTRDLVKEGEIGFFEDVWEKYHIKEHEVVKVQIAVQSNSVKAIRKKLLGQNLNYNEIQSIIEDIASSRLSNELIAYFVASGYSPGFSSDEIYFMTKSMAVSGEMLNFEGIVADKHSIGGVAGKGITPIVIPIVATFEDIIFPNTSSRGVTSASATTDMLEVIMPMSFSKQELYGLLNKCNAFMVWGGGMDLAPADDKIIQIQKILGIESIDKFVASIVAKKVAQGVNHVVFDVPYGEKAKISTEDDFNLVKKTFEEVCAKFNIKIRIFKRKVDGIDGNAVGPVLECIEFLKIYEMKDDRSMQLEEDALKIAGELIELCGKCKDGEGYKTAKEILYSGKAYKKFKQIVKNQGGDENVTSESLEIGGITWDFCAKRSGKIKLIDNLEVFEVCKALGNPKIKEAGMYFFKKSGEMVENGEKLARLYATTNERLQLGKSAIEKLNPFTIE